MNSSELDKQKDFIILAATEYLTKKMSGLECTEEFYVLYDAVADYQEQVIKEFDNGMEDYHKGLKPKNNNKYYMKGYEMSHITLLKITEILDKEIKKK